MGTLKTHQKDQGENDEPLVILRFSEQIDQDKQQQQIPVIQLPQPKTIQQTGQTGLSTGAATRISALAQKGREQSGQLCT